MQQLRVRSNHYIFFYNSGVVWNNKFRYTYKCGKYVISSHHSRFPVCWENGDEWKWQSQVHWITFLLKNINTLAKIINQWKKIIVNKVLTFHVNINGIYAVKYFIQQNLYRNLSPAFGCYSQGENYTRAKKNNFPYANHTQESYFEVPKHL